MDEPDDVVLVGVADRIARQLFGDGCIDTFAERILHVEAYHIGTRYHDFARVAVGEIEDVVHVVELFLVDVALTVAFFHQDAYLFFRMRRVAFARYGQTCRLERERCYLVEKPDDGVHHLMKKDHRPCRKQRERFCLLNSERFRRKFADDDMECRDDGERNGKCYGMDCHIREAHADERRLDELGDGRFPDPAETERRERDAELTRGQVVVQMVYHLFGIFRALVAFHDKRVDTRITSLYHRELCRDEKSVHQYQEHYDYQVKYDRR